MLESMQVGEYHVPAHNSPVEAYAVRVFTWARDSMGSDSDCAIDRFVLNGLLSFFQMMAIATLEKCYNNPEVFRRNVKIRKGEAVLMIGNSTSIELVKEFMDKYCLSVSSHFLRPNDQTFDIDWLLGCRLPERSRRTIETPAPPG